MYIKEGVSNMLYKQIVKILVILSLIITVSFAGTGNSIGTAGASEVLIPTGAKGVALNSSHSATVSGIDALFYNPAGISNMSTATEAQFSNMDYIADIGMSYAAFAFNMAGGTFGLSFKNFDFGDIKLTSWSDTNGDSGETFSPSFVTLTLGYSKAFSDRIRFGVASKLITESIEETTAPGLSIDMGVQYAHNTLPLSIGVVLRNLGPKMEFSGNNLEQTSVPENTEPGTIVEHQRFISQAFEQHAQLDMSVTYTPLNNVNVHGSFVNNSYGFNEFHFGGEYTMDMAGMSAWAGGGLSMLSIDDDDADWDDDITENTFGVSFGAGFSIPLGGMTFGVDYAFKTVDAPGLENNNVLAFNIGF